MLESWTLRSWSPSPRVTPMVASTRACEVNWDHYAQHEWAGRSCSLHSAFIVSLWNNCPCCIWRRLKEAQQTLSSVECSETQQRYSCITFILKISFIPATKPWTFLSLLQMTLWSTEASSCLALNQTELGKSTRQTDKTLTLKRLVQFIWWSVFIFCLV